MALVFQYGSNCSTAVINSADRLAGDAVFVAIAETVDDFELAFQVWSKVRRCAAANIIPMAGRKVWGVVWEIPDDRLTGPTVNGRKTLDTIEAEGKNYTRILIDVCLSSGKEERLSTYIAKDPQTGRQTNLGYVTHIVEGLREHSIADAYIAMVKQLAARNNPAIADQIEKL